MWSSFVIKLGAILPYVEGNQSISANAPHRFVPHVASEVWYMTYISSNLSNVANDMVLSCHQIRAIAQYIYTYNIIMLVDESKESLSGRETD